MAIQWRSAPIAIDWTKDNLLDLVALDHEGYLCLHERVEQKGKPALLPAQQVFSAENNFVTDANHRVKNKNTGALQLNKRVARDSGR